VTRPEPCLHGTQRIVLNGPFPTGFTLDTQSLAHDGYERAQETALADLGEKWTRPGGRDPGRMEFDVDNYGGKPLVPLYFLEQQPDAIAPLEKLEIKVFDFGVGVLTVACTLELEEPVTYAQFAERVEAFSRELPALVKDAITAANRQIYEVAREQGWLLEGERPAEGRLLWAHRIYQVQAPASELERATEEARDLLLSMSHDAVKPVTCRGMNFLAGVGSSVAVHAPGSDPRALQHAIELQNAYWAAGSALDRTLFQRLTALSVETRGCSMEVLEARAMEIVSLFEQVRLFRTILNSLRGALSPMQAAAWGALSEAWRLEDLLSAVDDKLDTLQTLYGRLRDEAAAERDSRINRGIVVFTAISLIGTLMAAYEFLWIDDQLEFSRTKAGYAVVSLCVALLAAYVLLTRDRPIVRRAASASSARRPSEPGSGTSVASP
jgi:hypothetical protein